MPGDFLSNYLRTMRLRTGLSQEDVAFLLGVKNGSEISRHEVFKRIPTLKTALSYEVIFGISVRELFSGEAYKVEQEVKERARVLASRILLPGQGEEGKKKRELIERILGL